MLLPDLGAELARLEGQKVRLTADGTSYVILDIAGAGVPVVGVIEKRGAELWLVNDDGAIKLVGRLATPRIAGPGYKVWVVGEIVKGALQAKRLGVLAPP